MYYKTCPNVPGSTVHNVWAFECKHEKALSGGYNPSIFKSLSPKLLLKVWYWWLSTVNREFWSIFCMKIEEMILPGDHIMIKPTFLDQNRSYKKWLHIFSPTPPPPSSFSTPSPRVMTSFVNAPIRQSRSFRECYDCQKSFGFASDGSHQTQLRGYSETILMVNNRLALPQSVLIKYIFKAFLTF